MGVGGLRGGGGRVPRSCRSHTPAPPTPCARRTVRGPAVQVGVRLGPGEAAASGTRSLARTPPPPLPLPTHWRALDRPSATTVPPHSPLFSTPLSPPWRVRRRPCDGCGPCARLAHTQRAERLTDRRSSNRPGARLNSGALRPSQDVPSGTSPGSLCTASLAARSAANPRPPARQAVHDRSCRRVLVRVALGLALDKVGKCLGAVHHALLQRPKGAQAPGRLHAAGVGARLRTQETRERGHKLGAARPVPQVGDAGTGQGVLHAALQLLVTGRRAVVAGAGRFCGPRGRPGKTAGRVASGRWTRGVAGWLRAAEGSPKRARHGGWAAAVSRGVRRPRRRAAPSRPASQAPANLRPAPSGQHHATTGLGAHTRSNTPAFTPCASPATSAASGLRAAAAIGVRHCRAGPVWSRQTGASG